MPDVLEFKAQSGKQLAFLSSAADIAIYGGARGGGKALALDTQVPTPSGWKIIADISVGDWVFTESGLPTLVVWKSEVMTKHECFRVTFDDSYSVVCDADHLWKTFTRTDLVKLSRRTDVYRERRRQKRASRVSGKKSALFTERIIERNKNNPPASQDSPKPKCRTTREIFETLKSGMPLQSNHAIPNHRGLIIPEFQLPITPYMLGLWLGDGTSVRADMTIADKELLSLIRKEGYEIHKNSQGKYGYTLGRVERRERRNGRGLGMVNSFGRLLDDLNLRENKHIPGNYLRASRRQRLELLQGLMDSDGYCRKSGAVEFTSIIRHLAEQAHELIVSLGFKASISEGVAKLNGRVIGPKFRINWTTKEPVFKLKRKLNRQKPVLRKTCLFRYIVNCERVPSVPVQCIQVVNSSGMFLCGRNMVATHNSFALLLEALRNTRNKEFNAMIFRRTYKQIEQPQGLWETSNKIYPYTGATGTFGNLIWKWPNGSYVRFMHMENPENRFDHLGAGIPLICFDELVTFTEDQFFFMLGSNRSTCGVRPYIRCTTNPDSRSWVCRFIEWWVDQETGYPIEERCGKLRYFIRDKETVVWADSEAELKERFPEMWVTVEGVGDISPAKSCTFIAANVFDNKILLQKDPTYLASLMALSTIDRERYLKGNWKISELAGKMFKREWFSKIINEAPHNLNKFVRYWDVAATEPKKGNTNPDWTCGVLMSLKDGVWYVLDVQRFRGTPKVVEARIAQTAAMDPYGTKIRMEQEPGASGVTMIDHYARFILTGYSFKGIPSLKNKILRAGPFSSAAEAGNVVLIRGPWNMCYLDELEQFKGLEEKNDQVDASSGAMNELKGSGGDWKFALPVSTAPGYNPLVTAGSVGKYTPMGG